MSRSMIDDVVKFLNSKKCSVFLSFPFDGALSGNPNEVVTKVLFINYREFYSNQEFRYTDFD